MRGSRQSRWRGTNAAPLAIALLWLWPVRGRAAQSPEEFKSLVVLTLVRYATWPELPPANGPITVCVAGGTEQAENLERVLRDKTVDGRAVRVLKITRAFDPLACQAVYLAGDQPPPDVRALLASAQRAHVLTIGESARFLDDGGAVNILETGGRLTFEVSLENLGRSGIEISSKLLRLAQIRRKKP